MRFFEKAPEDFKKAYNQRNYTNHKKIFVEKAIGFVSKYEDVGTQKRLLKIILDHTKKKQNYPVESLISNMVNNIPIVPDTHIIYPHIISSIRKEIKLDHHSHLSTLNEDCLRSLFKSLSIENVLKILKGILLEKGIFFIGNKRSVAFDVVESLTTLIFPLSWEFAKIVSYESNLNFFGSPVPLIYFIKTDHFNSSKLRMSSISDKVLIYLDTNIVENFYEEEEELFFPKKAERKLRKKLESFVKKYSDFYLENEKIALMEENQCNIEMSSEDFNYWGIRDSFFEFMTSIMKHYDHYLIPGGYNEQSQLSDFFDCKKFILKNSESSSLLFIQNFVESTSFSRFIQCRLEPETYQQKLYYSFFDRAMAKKRQNEDQILLLDLLANFEKGKKYICRMINPQKYKSNFFF